MNSFGRLDLVQKQPWRLRYLLLEELAKVMHEAEFESDDLTVLAVDDELERRIKSHGEDIRQIFIQSYRHAAMRF